MTACSDAVLRERTSSMARVGTSGSRLIGAVLAATGWVCTTLIVPAQESGPLLASMFQDHAVLQRERPIPVWGTARPGERVTVTLNGRTASASADPSGRWEARLPPIPAGGPYALTATAASGGSQTVNDVLVGDVWLCSGQSNMELPVSRTLNADSEIAQSANDTIRLLQVAHADSPAPLDAFQTPVRWRPAVPETVRDFSGTCYYFARELQKTVSIPTGLIHSSWGGSNIEAWIGAEGLRTIGGFDEALELLRVYAQDRSAAVARLGAAWEAWWRSRAGSGADGEPWRGEADASWGAVPAGMGDWKAWGVSGLARHDGMVWFRRTVRLTAAQAAQPATLSLGGIDEVDETWVNGQPVGNSFGWGTRREYELPAGRLHEGQNLLVVNVLSTWAQGGMLGPADALALRFRDGSVVPLGGAWRYKAVPPDVGSPPRAPWHAIGGLTMLYNAMITPIRPYGLRGALWYQGEANAGSPGGYETLLAGLMADWRRAFAPDLPFLVVQLPNFGAAPTSPVDTGWARIREAQRRAVARDAHAGLAVTIDVGDREELHPPNKQAVGRRLARAARHVVYGEPIAPSGPVAASARREAGNIVVTFDDVTGRLVTYSSSHPIGFELCGLEQPSCRFVVSAIEGNRAVLESGAGEAAALDTRVRYCWGDGPICTLYDESGLPAGPFELTIEPGR
jgi:sialate O-acetylesterase